jgi:acetyl esterase
VSLHPQAKQFFEYAASMGQPELHQLDVEQARALVDSAAGLIGPGPDVASVQDVLIPVRGAEIPGRIYRPGTSRATIVWFHGGGWVVGGLDSHDAMARRLANAAEATVVNVAYRLAPEHPYPVPLQDAWDALNWTAARHPDLPLIVGGDSAGGNLAAVTALRAREPGPALALQILVYPITDAAMDTDSYREHGDDHLMLSAADMSWFFDHYLPDAARRSDAEVSPLRAPDLSGVAPAIVVTDEFDPLRDEGRAYAERLREAGVSVTAHHYEDMMHVFFQFVNVFERGTEAVEQVGSDVRNALALVQA